jgi:hypothetical protein
VQINVAKCHAIAALMGKTVPGERREVTGEEFVM